MYNYIFIYFNLYVFRQETGRQSILNRMVVGNRRFQSPINLFVNVILICCSCFQLFALCNTSKDLLANHSVCIVEYRRKQLHVLFLYSFSPGLESRTDFRGSDFVL
jgi:hypothetical protein